MPEILKAITVTLPQAILQVGSSMAAKWKTEREGSDASDSDDFPVVWSSSNVNVATVDANGNVTAVAIGSTTIRATSGAIVGQAALTVQGLPRINIDVAGGAIIDGIAFGAKFELFVAAQNKSYICQKNFVP